eukprot:349655-Chlamydomonas_euryale.AAC.6
MTRTRNGEGGGGEAEAGRQQGLAGSASPRRVPMSGSGGARRSSRARRASTSRRVCAGSPRLWQEGGRRDSVGRLVPSLTRLALTAKSARGGRASHACVVSRRSAHTPPTSTRHVRRAICLPLGLRRRGRPAVRRSAWRGRHQAPAGGGAGWAGLGSNC